MVAAPQAPTTGQRAEALVASPRRSPRAQWYHFSGAYVGFIHTPETAIGLAAIRAL